jgi:hypothetical protein
VALTKTKQNYLINNGSGGNAHSFKNGKFYAKKVDNFVIGYFEALENCVLLHKEHGEKIKGKKSSKKQVLEDFAKEAGTIKRSKSSQ